MEDSALLQTLTLNPPEAECSLPPHRRRPLRSRTYRALIGILSHCHTNSPEVKIQEEVGGGDIQSSPASDKNGSVTSNKINSKAILVSLPDSKQIEDTLVKETSVGEDEGYSGGFDSIQATSPTLNHVNLVTDGGLEGAPANSISSVDFLVIGNQKVDCSIEVAKVQDNSNTVLDNQTVDLGTLEDLVVDTDFSVADYSEVLNSCLDMDMIIESSKAAGDSKENDNVLEENVLKEAEHELQLKEMELEKLIYSENAGEETGEANALLDALYEDATSQGERTREMAHDSDDYRNKEEFMCNDEDRGRRQHQISDASVSVINKVNGDCNSMNVLKEAEHELQLKEMELEKLIYSEEGEISGEADVSFDALYEDETSQRERSREMAHDSDDYFNKEEFMCNDEDRGCRQHQISDALVSKLNSDCNSMKVVTVGERQDCHSQTIFHDSHIETHRSGTIAPCSEKQSLSGRNLQEYPAQNQMSAAFEEDGSARSKKRKKGPLTMERKAKKKKKDRIKRAEKNRRLGVKRLKLQPVLKPKPVSYCRHYLYGRCHEGEKCKFSHDTVPLTKSKPCGHFARNSCMKGDACPYDHELSKYPCNNFSTKGVCSRSSDCLFSHEMLAKQSLSINESNPASISVQHSVPEKGGPSLNVNNPEGNFSSPLDDSNSSKRLDERGQITELLAASTVPRAAEKAPKGITFQSNVNIGCKTIVTAKPQDEKMSERIAPRKARGIKFLNFAQTG